MSDAPPPDLTLLASMPLPTLLLDSEQRITAWAPALLQAFPALGAQLGESVEGLFHPRDRRGSRGFHRAMSKHRDGVLTCEVTLREDSPVRLHMRSRAEGWVLSLHDLGRERQDQARLQGVKGELSAILSCMADGLLILDPERRLKDVNQAAQRCFRFASAHGVELSREALIDRSPEALFGPHAAAITACIDRVCGDPDSRESLALKVKDRSLVLSFNPIFVPKKGYAGVCITVRDLSEIEGLHAHLSRVMDCVQQGLFTLGLNAQVQPQFSAVAGKHFPGLKAGTPFSQALMQLDPKAAEGFLLQWEQLTWGFMPLELCLDQLPKQVGTKERVLSLEWSAITNSEGTLEQVLVVSTDITEALAAKASRALQAESLQAFRAISSDRFGFITFHRDACRQISQICAGPGEDPRAFAHVLHTLKGNAGMMGFQELMRRCHALEQAVLDADDPFSVDSTALLSWWSQLNVHIQTLLGDSGDALSLDPEDLAAIKQALHDLEPHTSLLRRVESWHREPVRRQVRTLAERAQHLAERLDRGPVQVHAHADGTRLNADRFAPFWSSLVHAVRNALDHGIEDREERLRQNKPAQGQLWIHAEQRGPELVVELKDDGRGIDWRALAERAAALGLQAPTQEALLALLLQGGLSTREKANELSGRGVGTSAVASAVQALGGRVELESQAARGTCIRCVLPLEAPEALAIAS